jgi:hypothetical protein
VTRLDAAISLLLDARTGPDAGIAVGTGVRLSVARRDPDPTRLRSQSPASRSTSVELDLFSGFTLRVIDPGLHVVFRFVRD